MEKSAIKEQITTIFKEVLENDHIALTDQTTAGDIEEWDSLAHIQLVVAIEKHFKIRFTSREIQSWKNVGEMIDSVSGKIY